MIFVAKKTKTKKTGGKKKDKRKNKKTKNVLKLKNKFDITRDFSSRF